MQFQLKAYCFPSFGGSSKFISMEQSSWLAWKDNYEMQHWKRQWNVSVVQTMKTVFNEMLRGSGNNAHSKDWIEPWFIIGIRFLCSRMGKVKTQNTFINKSCNHERLYLTLKIHHTGHTNLRKKMHVRRLRLNVIAACDCGPTFCNKVVSSGLFCEKRTNGCGSNRR